MLTAVAENEVCIPSDWPTRNYYYHPSAEARRTAYFANLEPRQKRLVALSRLWESVKRNFVFMNRTIAISTRTKVLPCARLSICC